LIPSDKKPHFRLSAMACLCTKTSRSCFL